MITAALMRTKTSLAAASVGAAGLMCVWRAHLPQVNSSQTDSVFVFPCCQENLSDDVHCYRNETYFKESYQTLEGWSYVKLLKKSWLWRALTWTARTCMSENVTDVTLPTLGCFWKCMSVTFHNLISLLSSIFQVNASSIRFTQWCNPPRALSHISRPWTRFVQKMINNTQYKYRL